MLQFDEVPPAKDTKSARIAAKLESQILSKKLVAGEFLPSQQELARQFDASSRSIREAFKQLEAKGLVEVSQGRRAMIKSNNLDQFVESLSASIISNNSSNQKFILDLVQVRNTLSVSAARVLSRLPDRHMAVRELKGITQSMEENLPLMQKRDPGAMERYLELDSQFHRILVKSNNNTILSSIYDNMIPLLEKNIKTFRYTYSETEKRVREYNYLCDALQNGQTDLVVALVLVTLMPLQNKVEERYQAEIN